MCGLVQHAAARRVHRRSSCAAVRGSDPVAPLANLGGSDMPRLAAERRSGRSGLRPKGLTATPRPARTTSGVFGATPHQGAHCLQHDQHTWPGGARTTCGGVEDAVHRAGAKPARAPRMPTAMQAGPAWAPAGARIGNCADECAAVLSLISAGLFPRITPRSSRKTRQAPFGGRQRCSLAAACQAAHLQAAVLPASEPLLP